LLKAEYHTSSGGHLVSADTAAALGIAGNLSGRLLDLADHVRTAMSRTWFSSRESRASSSSLPSAPSGHVRVTAATNRPSAIPDFNRPVGAGLMRRYVNSLTVRRAFDLPALTGVSLLV
jgi:hypothetical protein